MKKILPILALSISLMAAACDKTTPTSNGTSNPSTPSQATSNSNQSQGSVKKYDMNNVPISAPINAKVKSRAYVFNYGQLSLVQSGLQLYYQDHNKYPQTLNELIGPSYIHDEKVLEDYVVNKPYSYKNNGDNYEVCGTLETGDLLCAYKPVRYNSGIQGKMILSPTCPVQKVGVDCTKPNPNTGVIFDSKDIVYSTEAFSDENGDYTIELRPGTYELRQASAGSPTLKTQTVTVPTDKYIDLTLTFDTGIR